MGCVLWVDNLKWSTEQVLDLKCYHSWSICWGLQCVIPKIVNGWFILASFFLEDWETTSFFCFESAKFSLMLNYENMGIELNSRLRHQRLTNQLRQKKERRAHTCLMSMMSQNHKNIVFILFNNEFTKKFSIDWWTVNSNFDNAQLQHLVYAGWVMVWISKQVLNENDGYARWCKPWSCVHLQLNKSLLWGWKIIQCTFPKCFKKIWMNLTLTIKPQMYSSSMMHSIFRKLAKVYLVGNDSTCQ